MLYTRHTVLKRGCSVWDKKAMPEAEFEARLHETRLQMAQQGLDALVIYGDNWSYADLCYLTNYFPKVRGGIGVIPRNGPVSLLLNIGSRDIPFAKTLTWIEDVRASSLVGRDGAELLKEKNLAHAKVGLVDSGRGFPLPQLEELRSALPHVEWQPCHAMLQQMRLIKSARELAALRAAARVLEEIFRESKDIIQTGKKECEVVAQIDRLARDKGVEDVRLLAGKGRLQPPGTGLMGTVQGHWAVHLAIQYGRYWVEGGRSYNLDFDPKIEETYGKARDALAKMTRNIQPGHSPDSVDGVARQQLGDFYTTASIYGLGNGIGLDPWEAPFFDEAGAREASSVTSSPPILESDMTLAFRVAIAMEGKLVLHGDSYHLTPSGLVPLCAQDQC